MSSQASATPSDGHRRLVVITQPDVKEAAEFMACFDDIADVDVDLVETTDESDVGKAVKRAVDDGADTIASVGGDGALNLVIGALIGATPSGDPIAVVPVRAGTVNLMSQTVGLDTIDATADAMIADRVRSIDVGETDQGVFVLNASSGYDAAVIDDAADHSDAALGRLRFLVAGLKRLRRDSPTHVTVRCDGETLHDGPAMSVILMNIGQRSSDDFDVAPDAEFDDGLLDVAVVRAESIRQFALVVVQLALGRSVERRNVVRAQADRIEIEWAEPVASQRDGDADDPIRTLTARVSPRSLRIHHA